MKHLLVALLLFTIFFINACNSHGAEEGDTIECYECDNGAACSTPLPRLPKVKCVESKAHKTKAQCEIVITATGNVHRRGCRPKDADKAGCNKESPTAPTFCYCGGTPLCNSDKESAEKAGHGNNGGNIQKSQAGVIITIILMLTFTF